MIPRPATTTLTPKQYGAEAPLGDRWPINHGDGTGPARTQYALSDIYPTVQGEGRHAGTPMTIVRLQGCPVGCVFCDQPETWKTPAPHEYVDVEYIVDKVTHLSPRWALITGGEPCWHDLLILSHRLRAHRLHTALETSGVYPITGHWTWVTLSPKPHGLLRLLPDNLDKVHEVKWIVGRERDVLALEAWLLEYHIDPRGVRVSVQPVSAQPKATALCLEAVMAHPWWHVSTQLHKTAWGIA